jgi:hypothetical protein
MKRSGDIFQALRWQGATATPERERERMMSSLRGGRPSIIAEMLSPISSPQKNTFSMASTPISTMTSNATVAIMPQLANKLLTWSEFTYQAWTIVREAAKLAISSGTRDHQKHHIHEDVRVVLSATCDYIAGNADEETLDGEAYKILDALPLDKWVTAVL